MKIVALTREVPFGGSTAVGTVSIPAEFRVGEPVVPNGAVVTEILYARRGVANGEKGEYESYLVKIDNGENRIIPASRVLDIAVVNENKKSKHENPEAMIELPEG